MKKYYLLIFFTVFLTVLVKLLLPKPQNNKEEVKSFWVNKTHASSNYDIIACGDSRVYRSLSSEIFRDTDLNLSFLNLGYSSAGLSGTYLDFVTSKFSLSSKHKVLIVGISPHSFTEEAKKNENLNSYLGISNSQQYRYKYLSPVLQYFASYNLSTLIEGEKVNYLQKFYEDGWVASNYLLPDSNKALKSYSKIFSKYNVTKKEMVSTINKLKKIALSDVTVIASRIPTTQKMKLLEDSISGFDESFVKKELVENSIIWLDFSNSDFVSYDGSHLDEKSSRKLSQLIGAEVETILSKK